MKQKGDTYKSARDNTGKFQMVVLWQIKRNHNTKLLQGHQNEITLRIV